MKRWRHEALAPPTPLDLMAERLPGFPPTFLLFGLLSSKYPSLLPHFLRPFLVSRSPVRGAAASSPVPALLRAIGSGRPRGAAMMMRRVAASLVPPWLDPLLTTHFFGICPLHAESPRSESNLFCLDCGCVSFCFYCRSDRHADHRVIQIRRSSYHDVVRVAEIQKVLDIGGVQTYVINSARVLFLNERPQPRGGGRSGASASATSSSPSHICEICSRALLDPFRFCSLGCKLAGIRRNGDATFILNPGDEDSSGGGGGGAVSSSAAAMTEEEVSKGGRRGRWGGGSHEVQGHVPRVPAHPSSTPNSRRRKGIPRRAPFAA